MFARTERLLLRPGWAEDAPGQEGDCRPDHRPQFGERALALLRCATPRRSWSRRAIRSSSLLIFERTDGEPMLVGACGLGRRASSNVELGYWISRPHWGRGLASEAGLALVGMARALGLARLEGVALPRQSGLRARAREARLSADRDHRAAAELRPRRRDPGALFPAGIGGGGGGSAGGLGEPGAADLPGRLLAIVAGEVEAGDEVAIVDIPRVEAGQEIFRPGGENSAHNAWLDPHEP